MDVSDDGGTAGSNFGACCSLTLITLMSLNWMYHGGACWLLAELELNSLTAHVGRLLVTGSLV